MSAYTASPAKLRDGSWGARVMSPVVKAGDTVRILTKAGKSWTATVSRVVWTGQGISLCATGSGNAGHQHSHSRGKWTGCSCGSREDEHGLIPSPRNCWQCNHDA